jgi:heat shock protein HslJ
MSDDKFDHKVTVEYKEVTDKDYYKLSGCGNFVPDYRLNNIWTIETIDNKNLKEIDFMKGQPYIEINMKENRISGHDGCNNIMGGFRFEKNYIIIGNLAGTMMACPNLDISNLISKTLSNRKISYEFKNGKLYFIYQNKIIMTLKNTD